MFKGKVGKQELSKGIEAPVRLNLEGSLVTVDAGAKYQEMVLQKRVFSGAIVGQVTTVGLATTYTGLCLSNPIGSPVDLVLHKVGFSFIVAFAAGAHIGLMTGYDPDTNVTHTTPVTPRSQYFYGNQSGVGKLDSAATLPTAPTVNQIWASGLTGAITTTPLTNGYVDLEGSVILQPGAYAAIYTSTASGAAAGAFSFTWEELPR
jgi:hypothetical protein